MLPYSCSMPRKGKGKTKVERKESALEAFKKEFKDKGSKRKKVKCLTSLGAAEKGSKELCDVDMREMGEDSLERRQLDQRLSRLVCTWRDSSPHSISNAR